MKKNVICIFVLLFVLYLSAYGNDREQSPNILITYFTRVGNTDFPEDVDIVTSASLQYVSGELKGNTQLIAEYIQDIIGGDLFLITTEVKYPADYGEVINYALRENRGNSRPALSSHLENMQDYDVVFLGFPNWHFDMPMAIYSFLEEYDFSDKKIVPFCTHGGSRFSSAIRTLEEKLPDAVLLDGLAVSERNVTSAQDDVEKWLDEIGMLE